MTSRENKSSSNNEIEKMFQFKWYQLIKHARVLVQRGLTLSWCQDLKIVKEYPFDIAVMNKKVKDISSAL